MFYVFLHFFRSVLVRNLASVFVLPSDSREHLFLVHCTWARRACLEKTLIDGLLPSHAARSSPAWRGTARVIKTYEPSEWEDNEPAAKPQTTSRHQTPPLLLLTYLYPYKKVSGSEDKNVFPLLCMSRPKSAKLSATRMSYRQMT